MINYQGKREISITEDRLGVDIHHGLEGSFWCFLSTEVRTDDRLAQGCLCGLKNNGK